VERNIVLCGRQAGEELLARDKLSGKECSFVWAPGRGT